MKKDGYYFTGWYKDKECTTLYDFNTKIYDHVTLYAGWDDARALFYTYADDEAKELQERLKVEFPNANIEINNAGCVISSHCGKGTIGILYILK